MSVHAKFDGQEFKFITGYKIATCFQANVRIQEAFYVYIEQVIDPQFDFQPVNMDSPSPQEGKKRGELIISDNDGYRKYQFNNIDLVDYQTHFSHFRKVRLLKFKYSKEVTDEGNFCTLSNNEKTKDKTEFKNKFAQDYTYNIKGPSESLLSLSTKFTRDRNEFIRFGTQRTADNSFMEMVIDMDEEAAGGSIQPKTITYAGGATTIDKDNLVAVVVDETYGSFLPYSLPSLDAISVSTQYPDLLAINYDPLTPFQYLKDAFAPSSGGIIESTLPQSIETAVIVLKNGIYLDHSEAMV